MKADTPQLDAATYCEASVAGRFAEVVARGPDRPAIVSDAHTWCYAELDERSTRIASAVAATTEPGARVALRFAETAPLIASMLGVLKAGRVYVILGDSDPPQRRDAIVRDAGAALVIGDRADNAGAIERSLSYREAIESDGDATLPDIAPDDAATIVYTSGSTGAPKRVTHSQRTLLHWFLRYDAAAGLSPDDRFALVTPANYAAATSPIFGALLSGGALVPVDDAAREPRAFAPRAPRHRAAHRPGCVPLAESRGSRRARARRDAAGPAGRRPRVRRGPRAIPKRAVHRRLSLHARARVDRDRPDRLQRV